MFGLALAQGIQTHPLSQITPINVNLNMSNNTAGISYNITGLGYLGVGILHNPSYQLHVAGDVGWTGTLQIGNVPWARLIGYNLNVGWIGSLGGGNITPGTIGTAQIADNNVTLSKMNQTSCPAGQALQVLGGGTFTCIAVGTVGAVTGSGTVGYIPMWNGTSSLNNSIIFQIGGNVGIGTTAPASILHLVGTGSLLNVSNVSHSHLFVHGTSGNVGIGTTAPVRKLDVVGDINATAQLFLPLTGSSGGIVIGGDTQIFRGAADRLDLASGDSFNIVSGALQVGGGFTGGGLTIDQYGNILTRGNLTYSGYTYIISTLEVNATANYPFGINVGGSYSGGAGVHGQIDIRASGSTTPRSRIRTDGADLIINTAEYGASLRVNGSVLPFSNNLFNLGNNTHRWANIHGQNIFSGGNAVLTNATTFGGNVTGIFNALNLAANSVDSAKIVDGSITAADLRSPLGLGWGNLTGYNLNVGWIGSLGGGNITAGTIGTAQIADNSVTLSKLNQTSCPAGQALQVLGGGTFTCIAVGTGGAVTGSGIVGYIPMWNGTSSLNNSIIFQIGGNVGIGTTAPTQRLDVAGNINASIYYDREGNYLDPSATSLIRNLHATDSVYLATSTGNVGIGMVDPNRKLQVAGQIAATDGGGATPGEWIMLWPADSAIVAKSDNPIRIGHATDLGAGGWAERLRIDTVGNVGIGMTAPASRLHIVGTGSLLNVSNASHSHLFVNGTTGNIGIGTISPARRLHLAGGNFTVSNDTVARSDIYWNATCNCLVIRVS